MYISRSTLVYFQITIIVHLITFAFDVSYWPLLMYIRNQLIGLSFLCSCIQILDFLSFHHLFGPWAIIISSLVVDTLKFLVVLMIFEVGFTMMFLTMNQPYYLLGKFCYFRGEVTVHLKCEFSKKDEYELWTNWSIIFLYVEDRLLVLGWTDFGYSIGYLPCSFYLRSHTLSEVWEIFSKNSSNL